MGDPELSLSPTSCRAVMALGRKSGSGREEGPAHLRDAVGGAKGDFCAFQEKKENGEVGGEREITFCDQLSQVLQTGEAGGGGAAFEAGRSTNRRWLSAAAFAGTAPLPPAPASSLPLHSPGPAPWCWQPTLGMAKTPVQGCPPSRQGRGLGAAHMPASHSAGDFLQDPSLMGFNS